MKVPPVQCQMCCADGTPIHGDRDGDEVITLGWWWWPWLCRRCVMRGCGLWAGWCQVSRLTTQHIIEIPADWLATSVAGSSITTSLAPARRQITWTLVHLNHNTQHQQLHYNCWGRLPIRLSSVRCYEIRIISCLSTVKQWEFLLLLKLELVRF